MSNILETICIRVTKYCNLTCTHCRAGSSPYEKENLNLENFKESLKELKSIGLKHISISGGEPLLVQNIGEFVRFLLDEQFEISITTNGTISLDKTDLTKHISREDKIRFRFSIDGDKVLHERIRGNNSFEKTIKNLEVFRKWNGWIAVNTVVFNETLESITSVVKQIDHNLIDEWAFLSPVVRGNGKNLIVKENDYPLLLNKAEEILKKESFRGIVKKWDFLNTPNSSVLLNTNGDFVLSGVSIEDDILVTNINNNFDVESLVIIINEYENNLDKTYFKSSRWSKENYA